MSIIKKNQSKYLLIISICFCLSILIILITKINFITKVIRKSDITYNEINLAKAKDRFDKGTYLFLDSRSNFFYRMGHIKNAFSFPNENYDQIINNFENKFPKNTKIVIYCDGSTCSSSYALAKKLCKRGYFNTEVVFNGWEAWVDSLYPTERSDDF